MQKFRKILYPFSCLYAAVTGLRNELYDHGMLASRQYDFPVICVGNLSVGGTGKSPMVELLISLLKEKYQVATLSRGYKRSSTGFRLVTGRETAREVGDEPLQFKKKYPDILVAVDEIRTRGIDTLMTLPEPPNLIVLDDAFQHRKVRAGLNILLTSYDNLYSEDAVLPAGNLREPKKGRKRAQIVVVTKCPAGLTSDERNRIAKNLRLSSKQELFFTSIGYSQQVFNLKESRSLTEFRKKRLTLVTGIARPEPLVAYLKGQGLDFEHLDFPDHHNFSKKELELLKGKTVILTTEKDYMRLEGDLKDTALYYLPISTRFLEGENRFRDLVLRYVTKK